ncbi:MAG: hypothetical protein QHH14_14365, partial [Clostridiales bacterium]|nr:hypothetical protein [Clostridiales bacterium]
NLLREKYLDSSRLFQAKSKLSCGIAASLWDKLKFLFASFPLPMNENHIKGALIMKEKFNANRMIYEF